MDQWESCVLTGTSSDSVLFKPYYPRLTYFSLDGISEEVNLGANAADSRPEDFRAVSEANYVAHIIARLGLEGWELVGWGNNGVFRHSLFFKRAKQG